MQELRSDDLARLRKDIAQIPSAMAFVGRPFQNRFVIDANVIRDELSLLMRRKKADAKSALQEVIESGTVIAVASDWLREEVAEHLLEWAEQLNVPTDRLLQTWQEYQKKYLRFCSVAPISTAVNQPDVDPDDRPYVDLCYLINGPIVSRDYHIAKMGATQIAPEIMLQLRKYARAEVYIVTIKWGVYSGSIVLTGSAMLAGQLTSALVRSLARLPFWAQLALFAGAGIVALHPRSAQCWRRGCNDGSIAWHVAATGLAPIVAEVIGTYQTKRAEADATLQIVKQALPPPRRSRLEDEAFAACLIAGEPLSLKEIKERVFLAGYRSQSPNFEAYLRQVMTRSSRFTRDSDGRWLVSTMKLVMPPPGDPAARAKTAGSCAPASGARG